MCSRIRGGSGMSFRARIEVPERPGLSRVGPNGGEVDGAARGQRSADATDGDVQLEASRSAGSSLSHLAMGIRGQESKRVTGLKVRRTADGPKSSGATEAAEKALDSVAEPSGIGGARGTTGRATLRWTARRWSSVAVMRGRSSSLDGRPLGLDPKRQHVWEAIKGWWRREDGLMVEKNVALDCGWRSRAS